MKKEKNELKDEELNNVNGGANVKLFSCYCGESFDSMEELNKHQQSCTRKAPNVGFEGSIGLK